MRVPLVDVAVGKKDLQMYLKKVHTVLASGNFILGKELEKFEKEFANYLNVKYCVGVASGTDAILLSLKALGIGKGDEVILPAFSFVASVTPVLMLGAKPVFVDVRADLPLIDEGRIEQAITSRTRGIIAVHIYGYPARMDVIAKIAKKNRLFLIEDACQAHGSIYNNMKTGSFGDISAFSFYPSKNLGAFGDGGAVVTNREDLAEKIILLRNHGQKEKYLHFIVGYNSRLDTIQAAVLRLKLKKLDGEIKKRLRLSNYYSKKLSGIGLKLLKAEKNTLPALHVFAVMIDSRDELLEYLQSKGIFCGIHYPTALSEEAIFKRFVKNVGFVNAQSFAKLCLSLPFFPSMSRKQIDYVASEIKKYLMYKTKKKKSNKTKH